jgi:hypothetical protein
MNGFTKNRNRVEQDLENQNRDSITASRSSDPLPRSFFGLTAEFESRTQAQAHSRCGNHV